MSVGPDPFDPLLEEDQDDDLEALVDPLDKLLAQPPSPLPPVAPDGGFAPTTAPQSFPIPKATEETFICLRGPCRYYFESLFIANVENQDWNKPIKQRNRYCTRINGYTIDLMDEPGVEECSEWYPYTETELMARTKARQEYLTKKGKTNGS